MTKTCQKIAKISQNIHVRKPHLCYFFNPGLDKDGLIHTSKMNGIELHPNQSVNVIIETINGDRIGLRLKSVL